MPIERRFEVSRLAIAMIAATAVLPIFGSPAIVPAQDVAADRKPLSVEEKKQLTEKREQLAAEVKELTQSGRIQESIAALNLLLDATKRLYGESDPHVIEVFESLADRYRRSNELPAARKALEEIVRIHERKYGENDWRTVDSRLNSSHLEVLQRLTRAEREELVEADRLDREVYRLNQAGRARDAVPLAENVVAIRKKLLGEMHRDTCQAVHRLGGLYAAGGDLARALPMYRQALEIAKAVLGDTHPGTGACLGGMGHLHWKQGDYASAIPLYQQVLEIDKVVHGEVHPNTANSLCNLATQYMELGDYTQSLPLFQQALKIARAFDEGRHPVTCFVLNNLAGLYQDLGDDDQALPLFEEALELTQALKGDTHPDTATALHNLGVLRGNRGDFDEALALLQQALDIQRALWGEEHPNMAIMLNSLSQLYMDRGDFARAQPLLQQGLEINQAVLGDRHPNTAVSLSTLAHIYWAQGDSARGLPLSEQALEIQRKARGEHHSETVQALVNVAVKHHELGNYAEALPRYQKALEIVRSVRGENHLQTARSLNGLATLYEDQGQYAEALPLYRQALAIYQSERGDKHPDTARQLTNLGSLYLAQGAYPQALSLAKQALVIHQAVLGDDHPITARGYNNVALTYKFQGDYDQAEEWFRRGANAFLFARQAIGQEGTERATYASKRSRLHSFCTVLAHNGKPEEAWQWLEKSLGRFVGDELGMRRVLSDSEQAQLHSVKSRIRQGQQRLDELAQRRSLSEDQQALQHAWRLGQSQLHADLGRLNESLQQKYGVFADQSYSLREIQSSLAPGTALLTWVDDDEHWALLVRHEGDATWVRLPGTGADSSWSPQDQMLARQFQDGIRTPGGSWQELAAALKQQRFGPIQEHLDGIAHLVVLPSESMDGIPVELLVEDVTVSYAPSGTIFAWLRQRDAVESHGLLAVGDPVFLPEQTQGPQWPQHGLLLSAVLPNSNAAQAGLRANDVLLSCNGVALNSIQDLDKALQPPTAAATTRMRYWRQGIEGVADLNLGRMGITFHKEPAPEALAKRRQQDQFWLALRGGDWKELPGTRAEVASLEARFHQRGQDARVLTDSDASEQSLNQLQQNGELGRFQYLHFATHGEMNASRPLQSAVILSLDRLPKTDEAAAMIQRGQSVPDGRLTAAEVIQNWKLNAEMVTLSACESGLGKRERGEGYIGFSQALLLAGARSVMLSLWKVDDTATALLMDRFYENLLGQRAGIQPMSKSEALAEAKVWLKTLTVEETLQRTTTLTQGVARGKGRTDLSLLKTPTAIESDARHTPFADPYYWAAFVLVGDPR